MPDVTASDDLTPGGEPRADIPQIVWDNQRGVPCLRFVFTEHLTEQAARAAIAEWRRAFDAVPMGRITLIWDCREMRGYDSEARALWQQTLKELKQRIGPIWLITDSALIRMGASVMSLFSSLTIKPVRSESEITIG